jgi:hypothetical protein
MKLISRCPVAILPAGKVDFVGYSQYKIVPARTYDLLEMNDNNRKTAR